MSWPVRRAVALGAAVGLLAGCSTSDDAGGAGDAGGGVPAPAGTVEYRPGMTASTSLPDGAPQGVVVLVPGGGWSSADPSGLAPLSQDLVDGGLAVVTITYGTAGTGDRFPVPVDDVRCAVGVAADQVPGVPVVVVGHSAGAHLASLAGLVPQASAQGRETCEVPEAQADGVVGLAGPYDVAATGGLAQDLFGTAQAQDAERWREGNPLAQAAERPGLPFLLVHGDEDTVVPMSFTDAFADELVAGGHDVTVERLAGVDHADVYLPDVVGPLILEWVGSAVGQG